MTFLLVLLAIVLLWASASWMRRRHLQHLEFLAQASGFTSHSQLAAAITLARRAGLNPSQARPHYKFLIDAFGAPAVDAAVSMLLAGTFDKRFHGQTLDAALDQLSQEYPDPMIDAIVDSVLKDEGSPPPPGPAPKPSLPGPHGDGLPF